MDPSVIAAGDPTSCPSTGPHSSTRGWGGAKNALPALGPFLAGCRDFLGPSALRTLGVSQYKRLASTFVRVLPQVVCHRAFAPVYRAMGTLPVHVDFRGHSFLVDCPYADDKIDLGTHTFILIRELFIRNCYIRDVVAQVFPRVRTVLDLGANRGLFSTMMAARAEKVISVEVMPRYLDVIRRNMEVNGFHNYAIETAFVGAGGTAAGFAEAARTRTIAEILDQHHLPTVDLIKMDIEGSEFDLFEKPQWLDRVSALCMEVHPSNGHVATILNALTCRGFAHSMRDHRLKRTLIPQNAMYIYAAREDERDACS